MAPACLSSPTAARTDVSGARCRKNHSRSICRQIPLPPSSCKNAGMGSLGSIFLRLVRGMLVCAACLTQTHLTDARAQSPQQLPLYKQADASIESRIDDLLRRMTLEEK